MCGVGWKGAPGTELHVLGCSARRSDSLAGCLRQTCRSTEGALLHCFNALRSCSLCMCHPLIGYTDGLGSIIASLCGTQIDYFSSRCLALVASSRQREPVIASTCFLGSRLATSYFY